jgi:lipid-A-disaccharide synthase
MNSSQVLISAGEASGDMYAARLAEAMAQRGVTRLFGMGGPRMEAAGVELVAHAADVTVSGVSEVVSKIPALRRTLQRLVGEAETRKPNLAVLTDFPGFHLRLARMLKGHGIPCVYFIAPQFWAWRPWRARLVKRRFAKALCIFPFEEEFYRKAGVDVTFIGHPLVDCVRPSMPRDEFLAKHGLDGSRPIVALLPGSRHNEVKHNLAPIVGACVRIAREQPGCQFLMALAPGLAHEAAALRLPSEPCIRVVAGAAYEAISAATVAIVASGTATVETSLLGTPMVVVYRVAPVTSVVLRTLVTTRYFAMPNLIAGRKVVPELFQADCNPDRIAGEVLRLLGSLEARQEMQMGLADVRKRLGPGGAVERAADILVEMLGS